MIVRSGRAADRTRVTSIGFAAMRGFGIAPDPLNIDRDLATFGDQAPHKLVELVAELDGEVIGSILASKKDLHTAKITGFYVAEDVRGAGAGRRLLSYAIEACKREGCAQILLTTHVHMQAAMRLYEQAGFTQTGSESEDGNDYVHFSLALGPVS
ncbi:MAG: GNAT family N-acetyltransferase [Hyphomonadaceae bacterium JAD_PAG50586_4]|nr:MAG: GNAT family N-acetyltransferase [Hyphomonadaceae bacterium JAD_PAG50586_4]